jgi:hypothetical protein
MLAVHIAAKGMQLHATCLAAARIALVLDGTIDLAA